MKSVFVILVCIDLVDSTKFIETQGDVKASQVMRVYDRIFRGLLIKYNGLEIDKTDGALLIFETMREALAYVSAYHAMIENHLKLYSRVGIHCGHVIMHSNSQCFVSRGAKPVEVDGIHKVITARIMSVASGGQTLMSKRAGEYASSVRGHQYMQDIGIWKLKGMSKPIKLYAISNSKHRLKPPKENDKVKLVRSPPLSPRQIWQRRFRRWVLPHILIYAVYTTSLMLALLEAYGAIKWGAIQAHQYVQMVVSWIYAPLYADFWRNLF